MQKPQAVFQATIREVRSADDLVVQIDMGLAGISVKRRFRLAGVDAPDTHNQTSTSPAHLLRDEVKRLLSAGCLVAIDRENNGDVVGQVYYQTDTGWQSLNDLLISRGYIFNRAAKGVG